MVTAPAASAQDFPGPDEIVSSPNMKHELNIPQTAPLAGAASVGTDIAFQGRYAFVGNYLGFTIYDIKNPKKTKIVSQVLCPGSQNDISVIGNLLFLSTDSRRSDDSCTSTAQNDGTKPYWEGIKIFDVSDKRAPRYVKSVETACGSHTHTLVPDKRRQDGLPVRVLLQPGGQHRQVPAAARPDLDRRGAAAQPDGGQGRGDPGAVPGRRLTPASGTNTPGGVGHLRLPRHHRVPGEGPRGRRLHG